MTSARTTQGCEGDGYTEYLDDDMELVITLCPGCADCDPCIAEEEGDDDA